MGCADTEIPAPPVKVFFKKLPPNALADLVYQKAPIAGQKTQREIRAVLRAEISALSTLSSMIRSR
jgi:hypothetical protein